MTNATAAILEANSLNATPQTIAELIELAQAALAYRGLARELGSEPIERLGGPQWQVAIVAARQRLDRAARVEVDNRQLAPYRLYEKFAAEAVLNFSANAREEDNDAEDEKEYAPRQPSDP